MTVWLIFALTAALAVVLYWIGHTRYGHLRLSEMPGFAFILLAGPSYRRQAATILAKRRRHSLDQPSSPREALKARREALKARREALEAHRQLVEASASAAHTASMLLTQLASNVDPRRYPVESLAAMAAAREYIAQRDKPIDG